MGRCFWLVVELNVKYFFPTTILVYLVRWPFGSFLHDWVRGGCICMVCDVARISTSCLHSWVWRVRRGIWMSGCTLFMARACWVFRILIWFYLVISYFFFFCISFIACCFVC